MVTFTRSFAAHGKAIRVELEELADSNPDFLVAELSTRDDGQSWVVEYQGRKTYCSSLIYAVCLAVYHGDGCVVRHNSSAQVAATVDDDDLLL